MFCEARKLNWAIFFDRYANNKFSSTVDKIGSVAKGYNLIIFFGTTIENIKIKVEQMQNWSFKNSYNKLSDILGKCSFYCY